MLELGNGQVSHDHSLRLGIVGMLLAELEDDYRWTERIALTPDDTYSFLERAFTKKSSKCHLDRGDLERDDPY